ncbi:AtuA-related protein [Arthrospiribacter ruber]|uniref:AtuA-like ferredoxin-fold domain-containing protein n=1 Tax=Arthrospiribacter ruber TaxID=2487934 RepID=A0A951MCX8_9BACT|nr:hypothetical protein [Arthrospiribacter ruber]MBW3468369.1 hypothetical protein [Arthrospiribacter ruber]
MKKLYELAHSRAGDKGNILILSLIPFQEEDFGLLVDQVTVEKFKKHFAGQVKGEVVRYVLPGLKALQFVCQEALGSGVTTSLSMDTHGKSLSYAFLQLEIDVKKSIESSSIV